MSNITPVTSRMPPTTRKASADDALPADDRSDTDLALLRLLVGGMLIGADELRERLRRWDDVSRPAAESAPPQDPSAWLRYALVGMVFDGETRMRRGLSTMLAGLTRLADEGNFAYNRLAFALRRTPFDRVRKQLDELLFLSSADIDRWIDRWSARGWIEEQQGRRLAQQAAASVIDELLDYMAHNPEVRSLIEQQGADMADSAVGDVRERTAVADLWIERLAHNLLRRQQGDKPARPADNPEAPLPPAAASAPPVATRARTRPTTSQTRTPAAAAATQSAHSHQPG